LIKLRNKGKSRSRRLTTHHPKMLLKMKLFLSHQTKKMIRKMTKRKRKKKKRKRKRKKTKKMRKKKRRRNNQSQRLIQSSLILHLMKTEPRFHQ